MRTPGNIVHTKENMRLSPSIVKIDHSEMYCGTLVAVEEEELAITICVEGHEDDAKTYVMTAQATGWRSVSWFTDVG